MSLQIAGPRVYTETTVLENTLVTLDEGLITGIAPLAANSQPPPVLTFPSSYHLVPGFIDLHTHGADGHDVMDATADALSGICEALAAEGTTAFLATTMTAPANAIENALVAVKDFMQTQNPTQGALILGVHLEGPFLSVEKKGAQRGEDMCAPDIALMQAWEKISGNTIKLVTLAPEEKNGLALITYLKNQKIISSLGHTNATYAQAQAAIAAGSTYATHLFNAMRGIQQREPGTVGAALLSDAVMVELIVDGFHLHPAIVDLTLRVKGKERIILVTDAMRAKCLQDGCYELGGQAVHVKDGAARLSEGTLAGSVLRMPQALQNILDYTQCDLHDAVKMAAENPARVLNIFSQKGSIAVGKDADLVVLNDELDVVLTIRGGEIVFSHSAYVVH
jgi:N-acetylglucosamine-6-phosphate deacetylase